ncbi:hypothetical protein QQ020_17335 [Fulvivirgaceae bacterium BMA12]|uniref:Glucosamine inositolphosphorylceramide transferase 1 N-terminal domain-containing protein n=1 Tax=Agaribacillus aureus TaxID=3051825 RepID=A0ABT8L9C7_9BACT|nr:hypothetical protein [Fulvivirgaceae bacterium BMA12]
MKKVGILLNSTKCNKYIYQTFKELANSNQIELFVLISKRPPESSKKRLISRLNINNLFKNAGRVLFRLVKSVELKILSGDSQAVREHAKTFSLEEFIKNDIIHLNPKFSPSGLVVRYTEGDIEKIKSLDLDFIIRGSAAGIFKGEILSASKIGLISFHHGDNRWNRGGPAGFWEVYLQRPSTGFIIQLLSEELDGGSVIFRGEVATCKSFTENQIRLFNESNPFMAKIILDYAATDRIPPLQEDTPFGEALLIAPSLGQTIKYAYRTSRICLSKVIDLFIFGKRWRWGVAYVRGSWKTSVLRKGIRIKNPPKRAFSNPFIIKKDGRTVVYVEDYCFRKKKGQITAVEIKDRKNYEILGPVIEESFHLSFPYLFSYENALYMIPETSGTDSIRLYKCLEFPSKWAYQKDILSGVNAAGSMIFNHHDQWWLLTNMTSKNNKDLCSKLYAYHGDNPLSDHWIAHEQNPLVFNSNVARNGGILNLKQDFPVRVRQKQGFDMYGASLTLARITDLTPSAFKEEKIGEVPPKFFPKIHGCHHIDSNNEFTVYDFVKKDRLK